MTTSTILHNITPEDLETIIRKIVREESNNANDTTENTLYTPAEACKELRISQPTRDKLDRQGKLRSVRIGMKKFYRKQEIERFLNDGEGRK